MLLIVKNDLIFCVVKMKSYVPIPRCFFFAFCLAFFNGVVQGPYKDGDIILGGLLRVHLRGDSENHCGELDVRGLNRVFAMIFAIERINNDSKLLPNITLGYDIRDYCEIAEQAARISYDLIKGKPFPNMTQGTCKLERKSITALIGPDDSSTAVVIAGLLQAVNVSVISPTATSSELSDSTYKHLYRTAPSDSFKAKAMADLIDHFKWSYVAAVGQDDSYGRNGLWSVVREAEARKNSFCLAMAKFISRESSILAIRNIVTTLNRHENIRVAILWIHGSYATHFFTEVHRQNLTGRVWILSDVFISDSIPGFSSIFDGSIVVKPHRFSAETGFEELKNTLTIKTLNQIFPEWWSEIDTLIKNCKASNENANSVDQCFHDFVQRMQSSYTPHVIDAVYSMAHALNILFEDTTVKDIDYKMKLTMDINVMKSLLSRVSFVGLTGNVSFDKDGDRQSVMYDIVNFQQVEESHTKRLEQVVVGKWKENEPHVKRLHIGQNIRWNSLTNQPPKSECLDQCPAGTRKSTTSPCCWNCVACPRGTVNPIPGLETCTECPRGKKSNDARTHCVDLPVANLKYSSAGGVVILAFTVVGMVLTLLSLAVTCRFWNTPIVKASNRKFNIVLVISILLLLTLVVINLFEPSDTICKIIYPWRFLTYNLCLSFLLVKILRISSAFQIPLACSPVAITHTNRMQVVIITTMHVLLLLVLLPWQLLDPPIRKEHILTEQYIFIECKTHKVVVGKSFFMVTCSYIFIQVLFSAFCSFKIRKVPENFSEAKRIAFSMYIFSFSVLAYYPVEFSRSGWYVTVVDCVTILLTAYGFICCLLLPKLYIIWFRPELNNLNHIRNEVTQFSFGLSSAVSRNPVTGS